MAEVIRYVLSPKKKKRSFIGKDSPHSSFIMKRTFKFKEVFFAQIPYSKVQYRQEQRDLLRNVSKRLKINPPEAIIAITGVHHQFNIKDKLDFKRDLITAVTTTGAWIVSCGMESGVVHFIENAVDEYITMEDLHIPIVGVLSQEVFNEMKDLKKTARVKDFQSLSTNRTSDPSHTQFLFYDDCKGKRTRSDSEVESRKVFIQFLKEYNINSDTDIDHTYRKEEEEEKEEERKRKQWRKKIRRKRKIPDESSSVSSQTTSYAQGTIDNSYIYSSIKDGRTTEHRIATNSTTEIDDSLPVVLVLIEGTLAELKSACKMLMNNSPVVVIDGSGGAANILAAFSREEEYFRFRQIIAECFEDKSKNGNMVKTILTKLEDNKKKIYVYSLNDKTARVDKIIQDAMFTYYTDIPRVKPSIYDLQVLNDHDTENWRNGENENYTETEVVEELDTFEMEKSKKHYSKVGSIQKQLKVVEKWKRCDLAEKHIFVTKNRKELSTIQLSVDSDLKTKLQAKLKDILDVLKEKGHFGKSKPKYPEESSLSYFERDISKLAGLETCYFKYLFNTLKELKESMDGEVYEKSVKHLVIDIKREIAEGHKDSISELFMSMIFANDTDFVMLIINRIQNLKEFVPCYMPILYEKCNKTDVIQLIVQNTQHESKMLRKKIRNFLTNLIGDSKFQFYKNAATPLSFDDGWPYHHCFVWAILMNRKELAKIFWKQDPDYICAALFASAVLKELAKRAYFLNQVELSGSLKENAGYFETEACNLMTELYKTEPERGLELLVDKVTRYNSSPMAIAASQKLKNFMAHTACQKKLNDIWMEGIALHTPVWRVAMTVLLPVLLVKNIGFITIENYNSSRKNSDHSEGTNNTSWTKPIRETLSCVYYFYNAPIVKFLLCLITYLAFVVIFSIFVLTDLHPLSEKTPSVFEYMIWLWTLSLAIEEIRQIFLTNKGTFRMNAMFWAKSVWNIIDLLMHLLFFVSVMARCLLKSDEFYYARLAYAITLTTFILRIMHFFSVTRYLGPKVVMIGKMIGDLAFFFALFALFIFSFGIMYQAILFPNSLLPPWELFKDLIYLPYWQMYGELNIDRIEGKEPSECSSNPVLYTNGTLPRCAQSTQFNSLILATYLIMTNIVLINLLIAMFSYRFQKVQENSATIWKFNRYELVYKYYDRPIFPIPIVINLTRIIVLCNKDSYKSPFAPDITEDERHKICEAEKLAFREVQGKQDTINVMAEFRKIAPDIKEYERHKICEAEKLAFREEQSRPVIGTVTKL